MNGSLFGVHALAGLDATTGKVVNCFTGWIPNRSAVKALVNDGTNFYLGAEGTGGGVFDGRAAGRLSDGAQVWKDTCLGATQAVLPYKGVLYSGSHAHDCYSTPRAASPDINNRQHFLAQSISDKTILPWFPDTNDGIGEQIGPRALTMADGILWAGGEFTTVNEQAAAGPDPVRGGPGHRGAAGAAAQRRELLPGQDHAELEGLVGPGQRRPDLQDLPRRRLSDLARPGLALLEPARHELHGHRGARRPSTATRSRSPTAPTSPGATARST